MDERTLKRMARGGAREGAGRPRKDATRRERVSYSVAGDTRAIIERFAADEGISRSDAVNLLIRRAVS